MLSCYNNYSHTIFLSLQFYISSLSFIHSRSPLQFLLLLIFALLFPSLVGITRINDNWHHPHDVVWGIILGGSIALIVVSTKHTTNINVIIIFLGIYDYQLMVMIIT